MPDKGPLKHVVWEKFSTYRTKSRAADDGLEGDDAKDFRLATKPLPREGSSASAYMADLEQNQPATAIRVGQALLQGLGLEFQTGVWNDRGTVSKTKVLEYLFEHLRDEPYATLYATEGPEAAKAAVEAALARGTGGDNVSKAQADQADKDAKMAAKAWITSYRTMLGTK